MDRINHPSANNGRFVAKDPNVEGSGTVLTAEWHNNVQDEIINAITSAGLTPDRSNLSQLYESINKIVKKDYFNFSYIKNLTTPVTITGTGKINGYVVDKSIYDTDVTVDLPSVEWDSTQKAYVRLGSPDLYPNFNYSNDLAKYVNGVPTFWDFPELPSYLMPTLDVGNLGGVKRNSSTNLIVNKRLFALLKVSVGNAYSPHNIRRTFLDLSRTMFGQGAFTTPQLVARNIAVDGNSYGNAYISTALIPLTKNERRIDGIRLINNGVIDLRIVSYGFVYLDEDCLL